MNDYRITMLIMLFGAVSSFAQITFDANFESGNLKTATTADSVNYTVTTHSDIGGRWFYFRMIGVKNKFVSVRVSSSDVKRAMYSYDDKIWERFTSSESPATNKFEKTYQRDTVYAAYYNPYTYSFLQTRISDWLQNSFVELDTLGFTLRNLPIQELTITDPAVPNTEKIDVWVHARTHPGETPSSWQFDGFIEKLLSNDPVIKFYLKKIVFHCIPFTNPDGVYYGRSRTNFDGVDVESNWNKPDSLTCKEVLILKARMAEINNIKPIRVFQNLHSQASPYCTFWIHTASSTSQSFYRRENWFANLNTSENSFFKKSDYRFSNLSSVFPEGWLWANWGDTTLALTYETPYDFYSSSSLVTNENLAFLGSHLLYAIGEYLQLSHPERILLDNKDVISFWNSSNSGVNYFGDNYLYHTSTVASGNIEFSSPSLTRGNYDIYAWWQDSSINATNTKFTIQTANGNITLNRNQRANGGEWNFLANVGMSDSGVLKIIVSDSADGNIVADAFRIIYRGEQTKIINEYVVDNFELYQNYPNPFNPRSKIKYAVRSRQLVILKVFDILGGEVATLTNEVKEPGIYEVEFSSSQINLASGVYVYRLQAGSFIQSKKMIFLK